MKIVEVKLENLQNYFFECKKALKVVKGDTVICKTQRGLTLGKVESVMTLDGVAFEKLLKSKELRNVTLPLKPVKTVIEPEVANLIIKDYLNKIMKEI